MTESQWLACQKPNDMLCCLRQRLFPITDRQYRLFVCACWSDVLTPLGGLRTALRMAVRFADGIRPPPGWQPSWIVLYEDARLAADITVGSGCFDVPSTRSRQADYLRDIVGSPWKRYWAVDSAVTARDHRDPTYFGHTRWLTPQVRSLARDAYEQRERECSHCHGLGVAPYRDTRVEKVACGHCLGEGIVVSASLDPVTLAALADALEESGLQPAVGRTDVQVMHERTKGGCCNRYADYQACDCLDRAEPEGPLEHLRSPRPHVRGCWVIDWCRAVTGSAELQTS